MKHLYKKILTIGLKTTPQKEHKKIMLLNSFTLYWLAALIPFSIADFFLLSFEQFISNIGVFLLIITISIFVFFLQHKGFLTFARVLFIIAFLINTWSFCFAEPGRFMEEYFILIPLAGLILIEKKWITITILIVSCLCQILSLYYIDAYENIKIAPLVIVSIFIGNYLVLNYSQNLNKKQELALAQERDRALSDKIILEKQEIQLRELNEFKSHFFVNLSHEIRTPITLIKGYASKIELHKDDENKVSLNIISAQIKQVEGILNNILDLSKLDANKLTLQKTPTELSPFITKHYIGFKDFFTEKKITLSIDFNSPPVNVYMDADLISKSINNLLSNALKFTSENGAVAINVNLHNDDILISIVDNGLGIPTHDLHKIFERFYQSENDITQSQGSGIGLSFTKSILDAHGFSITVASVPEIKTEFTITIPKRYVTNVSEVKSVNKYINKTTSNTIPANYKDLENTPTILVVDDHKQMRSYIKSILNSYNIIEAKNGREALSILKTQTVDLLLTDYMMPVMDGEALVKEVKKLHLKIPVIIITARVDDFAKLNMLRIGVDGYLNKPFVEEELLLIIKNSLKAYHTIITFEDELQPKEKERINIYAKEFNEKISKFINKNITQVNFGVQDVANYFDVSKSTLNRKVKTILGQTTQQLIMQARIEKARNLQLKNQSMSKKDIANAVGVSNPGHLFKKLSEVYGNHYFN